jgi:hypothetical protein
MVRRRCLCVIGSECFGKAEDPMNSKPHSFYTGTWLRGQSPKKEF